MKTKNRKRKGLLMKYNKDEKNWDQVIEELKQKVSEKAQRFSRYR